ncbi:fluoride efflux transporter FluC [Brockia lithotrophica]|uniref:Fluoride-specific ion channel FluC n=1 Tax=Brockia lithotrophica TaxID=933949 RepID=A0A660L3L6_9BACL|nr:CrcB family protein [Brockia lithotrophica]RKQ88537.1 camphor resistance protein CrcB [Brockia lithotrophica]
MGSANRPRFRGRDILAVGTLGGVGSFMRWMVGVALPKAWEPAAVAFVNLAGAFGLGVLAEWVLRDRTPESARRFLWYGTGFLGGLTTFSGFSGDALQLGPRAGIGYGVFSFVAGWLALRAGRRLVARAYGQPTAERKEERR